MARPRRDGAPSTAPNRQRLSNFLLANLKPQPRSFLIWDTLQRGLVIQVQPSNHRTWYCLYSIRGRLRWYRIADASAVGLADARLLAARVMFQVAEGKDPAAERMASRNTDSFEELALRYRKHAERRNKSWKQAAALVQKHLLPKWAKLRAADISRADVRAVVASIDAPITANQVLASASAIFSWAVKEEVAGIKINPCAGVERNKTTSRERVLSDGEIPLFWNAFDSAGLVESSVLELGLLLGQRPGEIRHMRSEHIENGWWTLSGEPVPALQWPGTKNAQSHRLFLPAAARQIITELDTTGMIFANSYGTAIDTIEGAMRMICAKLGVPRATPHDLRRTFSTTVTALGFGRDAMNRVTNHREGGIASVYDRHQYAEENRKIMEAVSSRIMSLVEDGPANILRFKIASGV